MKKYRFYIGKDLYEEYDTVLTCDYHSKSYAVVEDPDEPDGHRLCFRTEWSPFRGRRINYKDDPDRSDVVDVVNGIMERAELGGRRDRLQGEHYRITDAQNGMKRAVRARETFAFSRIPDLVSCSVGIVLVILLSVIYTWIFTSGTNISWLVSLFPHISRPGLVTLAYIFQLTAAVTAFVLRKNDRGILDVITYVSIPVNLFAAIGVFKSSKQTLGIVLAVLFLHALIFILPPFLKKRKSLVDLVRSAGGTALNAVVIAIFVTVFSASITGVTADYHSPERKYEGDVEAISERYVESLDCLKQEIWSELPQDKKLSVLQSICDYECVQVLGCHPVELTASGLMDEETLGSYVKTLDIIYINSEHLDESAVHSVVDTVLHETRHVWQNMMVKIYNEVEGRISHSIDSLPLFDDARIFRYNQDNYVDGLKDFDDYYAQEIECDSREWAKQRMLVYSPYM